MLLDNFSIERVVVNDLLVFLGTANSDVVNRVVRGDCSDVAVIQLQLCVAQVENV